nr:retrovirus-related Pol polyprotein from transposon TNT 1-94 [Tanacetum cinerariifolium]
YVLDLLQDTGLTAGKPATFHLPQNLKLSLEKGSPLKAPDSYRRLVGKLLYLSMTRPDISYAVQHLSQFISASKELHMQATLHLLRYLKCIILKGLFYPVQSQLKVAGFSDAAWASCIMTRTSLTGYCICLDFLEDKEASHCFQELSKEILSLMRASGFEGLTFLPPNENAISSKLMYKTKYNLDGTIERLKARLVIRGFDQIEGTNYKHTFSPVSKAATVRVLIAIATTKEWPLHQLYVNNAFLHGYVEEEIYMKPPEGYFKASPGQVCKLSKSLYGLNQASRQWNQ